MVNIHKALSYNDVLLVPRYSGLEHLTDADIKIEYDAPTNFKSVPVINAPMDKVVTVDLLKLMVNKFNMPVTVHRWFDTVEDQIEFIKSCGSLVFDNPAFFVAVGAVAKWKDWIDKLNKFRDDQYFFGILVDVANGDTKSCVDTVEYVKKTFDKSTNIMAGNVATKSGFTRLELAGANFIRVGVGGGSICSTRTTTGFGVPTLQSVIDCAEVKEKAYIVADGGIENAGDICKSIAAGADMVMLGKMLAATSLSNGQKLDKNGMLPATITEEPVWVQYSGMASKEAIQKLNSKKSVVSVEGVSGLIPYTGESEEVIGNIIGNMQSSLAYYAGYKNWSSYRKHVKFVEISSQGWEESLTRVKI
jgi:IMP dehydrogenase/GMP reductase